MSDMHAIDAERYRWLRKNFTSLIIRTNYDGSKVLVDTIRQYGDNRVDEATVDAAIDAAMLKERNGQAAHPS